MPHNHINASVYIATGGLGLKLKIEANKGIELLELPDDLRLQPEPDKLEGENKKLHQQLSRIPKLSVAFESGKNELELIFAKPTMKGELSPSQIRKKYPLKDVNIPEEKLPEPCSTFERINAQLGSPTYQNKKLEEYYKRYDKYYADIVVYRDKLGLCFCFKLVISNAGTAPTSNIDLYLNLPDSVKAVDKLPGKPKCPPPPGEELDYFMRDQPAPTLPSLLFNNNGKPVIEEDGSSVRISVDELKHEFYRKCDYITLRFQDWESIKPFDMGFSISANEIPEATEGTLHVVARVQDQHQTQAT